MKKTIKETKRAHAIYQEWANAKKKHGIEFRQLVGKWHYVYSSKKGDISLVKLVNYFDDGKDIWEIYCITEELFVDVERYNSKKEAEKRIEELL